MRRVCLMLLVVAGCRPQVDPNAGRFSCAVDADCGDGWECRPQVGSGGRCFKLGTCKDIETCDGVDENCNGEVDETFPEQGNTCMSGALGVCAVGEVTCQFGDLGCRQTVMATSELCNGLDDDCDGRTDEDFDFTTDSQHCGACNQRCDAGTGCALSQCRESTCDDLLDNDDNGLTDCDDDFCFSLACDTTVAPALRCGLLFGDGGLRPDGGPWDAGPMPDAGSDGAADGGVPGDGGVSDGGSDGGLVDAGRPGERGCFLPETVCDNGFDDDGDFLPDCLDPDCDGQTCVSGTQCTMGMCPGPG